MKYQPWNIRDNKKAVGVIVFYKKAPSLSLSLSLSPLLKLLHVFKGTWKMIVKTKKRSSNFLFSRFVKNRILVCVMLCIKSKAAKKTLNNQKIST